MRRDVYATAFGSVYRFYMERPRLSRVLGHVVWGGDVRPYYASMGAIGDVPAGGTIVDAPVGAGPAFRALKPGGDVRYIGVDLSDAMLAAARERAAARGVEVELVRGDATALPLDDGVADLFLSYWGLHTYDDPRAGVADAARVLKPGGRLVGASFVRGETLRQRLVVQPNRGGFGPVPTYEQIEGWLGKSFDDVRLRRSGPMTFFTAAGARSRP